MSLDVTLRGAIGKEIYSANITHNLNAMAEAAGIYRHLWRPEELGIKTAGELVQPLKEGLAKLVTDAARFDQFDSPNGWGTRHDLVRFVSEYLEACENSPTATIDVSR